MAGVSDRGRPRAATLALVKRPGVFTSVAELEEAILLWAGHWNDDPKPFVWKATAADIIEKVRRGRAALNRQINSTTDH